jgi:hypothetical protein
MKRLFIFFISLLFIQVSISAQDDTDKKEKDSDKEDLFFIRKVKSLYSPPPSDTAVYEEEQEADYEIISNNEKQRETQPSFQNKHVSLSYDPLGFLLLGPSVGGELLLQKKGSKFGVGIYLGYRLTSYGLATNAFIASDENMDHSFTYQYALKLYPSTKTKADGFFIGYTSEVGQTNTDNGDNEYLALAVGGILGYKWADPSGFSIEVSDMVGELFSQDLKKNGDNVDNAEMKPLQFVFYNFSIRIGYSF